MQSTIIKKIPDEIKNWLLDRKISEEVIKKFNIHWNGSHIVIPVYDQDGNFLFNKYRRSPFASDGPKYQYDKGGSVVLYNSPVLKEEDKEMPIFICEGEADALVLLSFGLRAVTSTGGSMSFQDSWINYFTGFKNILICMDNDEAGIKGGLRIQSLLPEAQMIFLPPKCGKDVTDFFRSHTLAEFLSLPSESLPIPSDVTDTKNKKFVHQKLAEFKHACEIMKERERVLVSRRIPAPYMPFVMEYLLNRYELYKSIQKRMAVKNVPNYYTGNLDVKKISITNFIQFNNAGYAPCIWHSERTASMFYNNETRKFPNTVKCFGCGMMGDVVDVVMQIHNLDFKQAVEFLKSGKS